MGHRWKERKGYFEKVTLEEIMTKEMQVLALRGLTKTKMQSCAWRM